MDHDFLASWRQTSASEEVTGATSGKPTGAEDERHRTVGVSMSPGMRAAAVARARMLGLPFSRYVAWCVEAELEGRPPQARFARRAGRK